MIRKSDCLGCAVLLCFVDLACFFLPSFSSLIKTCICMSIMWIIAQGYHVYTCTRKFHMYATVYYCCTILYCTVYYALWLVCTIVYLTCTMYEYNYMYNVIMHMCCMYYGVPYEYKHYMQPAELPR